MADVSLESLVVDLPIGDYSGGSGNYVSIKKDGGIEQFIAGVSVGMLTTQTQLDLKRSLLLDQYTDVGNLFQTTFGQSSQSVNTQLQSSVIRVIGDSTSLYANPGANLTSNWIKELATEYAAANTDIRVDFFELNAGYEFILDSQLNVSGDARNIALSKTGLCPTMRYDVVNRDSLDLDVRVKAKFADWTPTGNAGITTLVNLGDNTGSRAWRLALLVTGELAFEYSTDGTSVTTVLTGVVNGYTINTFKWLRVTVDVDDGAAGHVVTFYDSDDGSTWNTVFTTTESGAITLYDNVTNLLLGTNDFTSNNDEDFTVESVVITDGIDGPNVMPVNIELFAPQDSFIGASYGGQPTLSIMNGAFSGNDAADFIVSNKYKAAITADPYGPIIYNLGINEGSVKGTQFIANQQALIDLLILNQNSGEIVVLTQNPTWTLPLPLTAMDGINSRYHKTSLMQLVKKMNINFINTFDMIEDYLADTATTIDSLVEDGTHYNQLCVDNALMPTMRKIFFKN